MEEINLTFYKALASILVFVLGFFLKAIYNKFTRFIDHTSESISNLNLNMEKLILKHDHSYDLIKRNENSIIMINKEIDVLREFRHKHLSDYEVMKEILKGELK